MTDHENKAIGKRVGNYLLVQLVGSGGFADVYLGEHQHLGTYAAIKVLHTKLADEQVEQFRQEARTLAHLIHAHIVRVLDFDVEDQFPFLVMDYAPGGTLRQRHPSGTTVPLPTAIGYLRQVASALDYAHNQKLIHRDVKPENMLIDQQGQIMLSDFGVAYILHSSRSQTLAEMAGTISYIAPEQIQGRPHFASDQYALGVVLYEWLSGERPFKGSFTEIVSQHLVATPPPLHGHMPGILPAVENVIFTTLEKDPCNRFSTAQTFVRALEQASRDGYTVAPYPASAINTDDAGEDITQPSRAISEQGISSPAVPLTNPGDLSTAVPAPITSSLSHEAPPRQSISLLSFAGAPSEPLAQPFGHSDGASLSPQMAFPAQPESQLITPPPPPDTESRQPAQQQSLLLTYFSTAPHAQRKVLIAGGIVFLILLLIIGNLLYRLIPTSTLSQPTAHATGTAIVSNTNTGTTEAVGKIKLSVPPGSASPASSKSTSQTTTTAPQPTTASTNTVSSVASSQSASTPTSTPIPMSTPTPTAKTAPTPTPAPAPKPTPTPTPVPVCPTQIQYGSTGTEVNTLQAALNNHSFPDSPYAYTRPLMVDGQFGPQTQLAVKDFQTAHGLQVDGQVGPLTWHALGYC